jgi:hypothetical protein
MEVICFKLEQLLLIFQTLLLQFNLKRRSTVLSHPLQLAFPAPTHESTLISTIFMFYFLPRGSTGSAVWQRWQCHVAALAVLCGSPGSAVWQRWQCRVATLAVPCGSAGSAVWQRWQCRVAALAVPCGSAGSAVWQHWQCRFVPPVTIVSC